ncbi:hypothetical protein G6F62_013577 [Rhizopus arrhizus]|nr:hypothetical protein G6F62_013577 [Rhizopus arrhizus]
MLQYLPVGNARMNERMDKLNVAHNVITGPNQLTTMDVVNDINHSPSYKHQTNRYKESTNVHKVDQQDIVTLIQETIRNELNKQQSYYPQSNRNNQRNYRNNYYNRREEPSNYRRYPPRDDTNHQSQNSKN